VGKCSEYQPKGGDALQVESKGRYGSCVDGRWDPLVTDGTYLITLEIGYYKALYKIAFFTFKREWQRYVGAIVNRDCSG